jgi:hypothetical protein
LSSRQGHILTPLSGNISHYHAAPVLSQGMAAKLPVHSADARAAGIGLGAET